MSSQSEHQEKISTASVDEGLDFACSLISSAIAAEGEANPEKALSLLNELTSYIQFRYVGETLLALEYLAGIGRSCNSAKFRSRQFWRQLKWIADQMQLTSEETQRLELKDA